MRSRVQDGERDIIRAKRLFSESCIRGCVIIRTLRRTGKKRKNVSIDPNQVSMYTVMRTYICESDEMYGEESVHE